MSGCAEQGRRTLEEKFCELVENGYAYAEKHFSKSCGSRKRVQNYERDL